MTRTVQLSAVRADLWTDVSGGVSCSMDHVKSCLGGICVIWQSLQAALEESKLFSIVGSLGCGVSACCFVVLLRQMVRRLDAMHVPRQLDMAVARNKSGISGKIQWSLGRIRGFSLSICRNVSWCLSFRFEFWSLSVWPWTSLLLCSHKSMNHLIDTSITEAVHMVMSLEIPLVVMHRPCSWDHSVVTCAMKI